jgi:hypothetical protein
MPRKEEPPRWDWDGGENVLFVQLECEAGEISSIRMDFYGTEMAFILFHGRRKSSAAMYGVWSLLDVATAAPKMSPLLVGSVG